MTFSQVSHTGRFGLRMALAHCVPVPTIHPMIAYQQLQDVNPDAFAAVADDWLTVAKEAGPTADDIYGSDTGDIEDNRTELDRPCREVPTVPSPSANIHNTHSLDRHAVTDDR
ncbi:hypothetical protein SaccyDRAFT_3998 [Saccharomonospora cyanea NA-134]|uniref:Uncharacterized protein n=2 Tax=Saccharomonospora cyanea TaxID=40989 RepID=H5XIG0_9PSEU|nr:hypothetical protein SaccyDRAFT_3998 [Saccharomonospora cyanea NA-134]